MSDALPPEEWRPIADFPAYEVSNWGFVRRCVDGFSGRKRSKLQSPAGKFLGPALVKGYLQVALCSGQGRGKLKKIHQLVCEAFHGPKPTPGHEVAHNDGDPLNNRADNLRWATQSSNNLDRHQHGTMPRGASHPRAKLDESDVRAIRRALASDAVPVNDIAQLFGITPQAVWAIRDRKSWAWLT